MKPGDLVEFKAGLFGLEPPKNLGIYLERVKKKGNFYVVLHTLRGKQEIRPDNLTARRLTARVDVDAKESEMTERLKILIGEVAGGSFDERPKFAHGELNDRVLWNKVWEGGEQTPSQMAERFFEEQPPKPKSIEAVRNVLATCARPGVGYFERAPGREERWMPITLDEMRRIQKEIEALARLRKKLVVVEEVPPPDDWTPPKTLFHGVKIAEAGLDEEDRARLDTVRRFMAGFVLLDRSPDDVGLAGTRVHTLNDFTLFTYAKWLATDWTQDASGGAARASLSSIFVEFLIDTGYWSAHEAIATIARRKVLANGSFSWEEDATAERAAERFPREFPLEGRRDLREQVCWTIDPADAKDHDDAVGLEWREDGGATLWVHIADVSHYVDKDSALDRHARERATSVYLPTGVLPMLPPRLSNDLCSLNAGEDRFAMTVALTYDAEGNLAAEDFCESVIRVAGNVSYEEVLAKIAEGGNEFARMEGFARRLDAKRRGLPIETGELRVRVTDAGVTHAVKRGTAATKMIEVFMVAANEAVARKLTRENAGCLYRCHPLPDRVGAQRFNEQMKTMELPIELKLPEERPVAGKPDAPPEKAAPSFLDALKSGGKLTLVSGGFVEDADDAEPTENANAPAAALLAGLAQLPEEEREAWLAPFREALAKVEALPDPRLREVVYVKALGAMGRAIYTPENLGHYGLGSACYAHFTSPIRRYADLVVHRQLRWVLRGRPGEEPHARTVLADTAQHTSDQSVAADYLERDVVAASMVFASRDGGWDGPQDAIVNGVTKGGLFFALPRGLEARVASSDIPGGPWSVDEAESMLFVGSRDRPELQREVTAANWREMFDEERGEVMRVRARLGDRLTVSIRARDYVDGRVAAKLVDG